MMLTDGELSWIRSTIADTFLDATAVIKRDAGTVNSYYEYVESESAVGTVSCRLDPYSKQDSQNMVGERDAARNWYQLTVPYDTDIQPDDTVTVSGVDYTIIQTHETHSYRFTIRLVVARID